MQAFRCDFCKKFYEGGEEGYKKNVTFNRQSLEVNITIQNQQSNQQYDICEDCLGGIIKSILIEEASEELDNLKKEEEKE